MGYFMLISLALSVNLGGQVDAQPVEYRGRPSVAKGWLFAVCNDVACSTMSCGLSKAAAATLLAGEASGQ